MKEIKITIPDNGEVSAMKTDDLHAELLKLPAKMYVDLYHMMKNNMENSYYISNGTFNGGMIRSGVGCV